MAEVDKCAHAVHLVCGDTSKRALNALHSLLQKEKTPDIVGPEGLTPLHVACLWGNVEAVRLLLAHGASPDKVDDSGYNALQLAQKEKHESVVKLVTAWTNATTTVKESYLKSRTKTECPVLEKYKKAPALATHGTGARRGRFKKIFSPLLACIKPANRDRNYLQPQIPSENHDTPAIVLRDTADGARASKITANYSPQKTPTVKATVPMYPQVVNDNDEETEIDPSLMKRCEILSNNEIRAWLKALGFDVGPITATTRPLYDKKLALAYQTGAALSSRYSSELQLALRGELNLSDCVELENNMTAYFDKPENEKVKLREGRQKMSFCYLLLDPSITQDLPRRINNMNDRERLQIFVDAIFYVGKGKKSRPYQHLKDAIECQKEMNLGKDRSAKIRRILGLWKDGLGVVSLHIFHNVLPVDAFSREAAMIDAIGVSNLTNEKRGDYYGMAKTCNDALKRKFGVYLLRRALTIFLAEGERQLLPKDIQDDKE